MAEILRDKTCRVHLTGAGLFLSDSKETKWRSSAFAHLYCKAVRTWKKSQYGMNCHSCDSGWGLQSHSGGWLNNPKYWIMVTWRIFNIRRNEKRVCISDLVKSQIQIYFKVKFKIFLKMFNFSKLLPERKLKEKRGCYHFFFSLWEKQNKTKQRSHPQLLFLLIKWNMSMQRDWSCLVFQLKCSQQFSACPVYPSNLLHDVKVSLSENKYLRASSSQNLRYPKMSINLEGKGWLVGDLRAVLQSCVGFLGKLTLKFLWNTI